MEAEILKDILAELELIRWLLASLFLVIALHFVNMLYVRYRTYAATTRGAHARFFKEEAQGHLDRGAYKEAKKLCSDRIESNPEDVWAHYYLGLSCFRLNEDSKARAHFAQVARLHPSWKKTVDPLIQEIDKRISEDKPKLVQ